MKTFEQIVEEWQKTRHPASSRKHETLLDLCRRVAGEQKEHDAKIAEKYAVPHNHPSLQRSYEDIEQMLISLGPDIAEAIRR